MPWTWETLSKCQCFYYHYLIQKKKQYGECNGTPLQYCCLENPMDGGAW